MTEGNTLRTSDEALEPEAARTRAATRHDIEAALARALAAERQLVAVESRRAVEAERLDEALRELELAQERIAMMEQTQLWRLGGRYWALRARVFRRS